jgi:hypothetical protein
MGTYAEAAGVSLEIPEDTLLNKKYVTDSDGRVLGQGSPSAPDVSAGCAWAASASHVYGKPLTAAESFTAAATSLRSR